MSDHGFPKRVLALDVHSRSFGYAIFEGPNDLLDWGVKSFRPGVNAVSGSVEEKAGALLDDFLPSAVVVREVEKGRHARRARMLARIEREARSRGAPLRFVSRADLDRAFVGFEANKYEVARALAAQFPSLASRLPPKRKCWQSEDYRMGIFDAAAVGVAYFARKRFGRVGMGNASG